MMLLKIWDIIGSKNKKIKKIKKVVDSVANIIYNKLRSQLGEMVELV